MDRTPQPFPETQDPNAAAVATPQDQALDHGFAQTPESTAGHPQEPMTPEHEQVRQDAEQAHAEGTISRAEYEAIQQQLQEKDSILKQIQQVAEQQRAEQADRQYREQLRSRLTDEVKRSMPRADQEEIEQVVGSIYGLMNGEVSNLTQRYQQQMEDYHREVEQAFKAATLPGFADDLIKKHGLPEEVRSELLSFSDENAMAQYALRVKAVQQQYQQHYQQQVQQQAIQQQVQDKRNGGVFAVGGVNAGTVPERPYDAGTSAELMPALRDIFGL